MEHELKQFKNRCRQVRLDVMEMVRHGRRGHIPSAFSLVEPLVVLYDHILNVRPEQPDWPERDRLVLSKGHGCLALYAILAQKGFFSKDHYRGFCLPDGILGGHPETKVPGVEASTGSLGHGMALAIGFALAGRIDGRAFRNYVILGDGECGEGSIWESALAAAKHQLDNLIVLVDYNKYMSFGPVAEVCNLEPFADKWRAFGFDVAEVDTRKDPLELKRVLEAKPKPGKPLAVICHTIKGQGVSFMEGDLSWHHKPKFPEEDLDRVVAELEREDA